MAGSLKRDDRSRPEEQVFLSLSLMCAVIHTDSSHIQEIEDHFHEFDFITVFALCFVILSLGADAGAEGF